MTISGHPASRDHQDGLPARRPHPIPFNPRHPMLQRLGLMMAGVALVAGLGACGGGSDSTTPTPAPGPSTPPPPPASPPPAGAGDVLRGLVRAPVGSQLVLQNNGADSLPVTVPQVPNGSDRYGEQSFAFATPLASGAAYAVSVSTMPAGQTCRVYAAPTGTVPVAATVVRVGCEYRDDHVVRSDDDSVLGSFFDSRDAVIGGAEVYGEGRFVAFVSTATIGGASGSRRQVFWRDRLSGETRLVSTDINGLEGNNDSWAPAISADGTTVAFESYASNLVAGDTNGVRDIYLWSAATAVTTGVARVSVGAGGAQADSESFGATLSADGRVVAFSSGASNLTPGVSGTSTINVYRRDLAAGSNTLVSIDRATGEGAGGDRASLSEDGARLAFWSYSSQITAGDINGLWDIFVFDAASGQHQRVSLTSGGGERNQGQESASRVVSPSISGDGRYVAYATTASNVVAGDTNDTQDVFVVDTQSGAVVRASLGAGGVQGNADTPVGQGERIAISYDGQWVGFSTAASNLGAGAGSSGISNALMRNWATGETLALTDATVGSVSAVAMSRQGGYALFGSSNPLDGRFASSGIFAHYTGLVRAWWWID